MTLDTEAPGAPPAREPRPATQAFPEPDRSVTTARLLAELHATDDEQEKAALRAEVVVLNMGVARAIAHRYRQRGLAEDDLVQAAYVGLVKAVNGFDPSHERDFLSYAVPTVTGEVKRYFRDFGWSVRPPRRVQELQGQIAKASSELTQRLGRSPRPSEVAEALGLEIESVIEALAADGAFTPASLDVPVGADGAATLGDLMPDEAEGFESAEARVMLGPAVRNLAPRDRRILELRFFHGWTQEQIAQDIGVTQMQVSRLLSRILRDLRNELL
ncbi:MAG: SigB/SigF/SigG family RNA polymerase sigma factor [Nocardioidaceae bacterium]|nr:SigB/SigF/SigG family RNA polymerase sigma factor [Nocardioidaceae bacterium]NUS53038.1 SigB/SigF/SigG family RNA polymerase sigma factor [Nocardioidaceae bacterium]